MWMVMLHCGWPQPSRDSSIGSRLNHCELRLCTVKDSRQLIRVFPFALEGTAYSREGLGERKDVTSNQQIGIGCPNRMPVNTLGSDSDLRYKIGPAKGDTVVGSTT